MPIGSTNSPRVIYDLLISHAKRTPGAIAAVDGDTTLSFEDLRQRVDVIAKALIASGAKAGDRVATLTPPSLDFWLTYLASTSIGCIWQGLNPVYKEREFDYLLDDAQPTVVFCRSPFDGRRYDAELQALSHYNVPSLVTLGVPSGQAENFESFLGRGESTSDSELSRHHASVKPSDIAAIVYTSGTTGQPKGAMLSHETIVRSAVVNATWMGDRLASTVCAAPINHVGALNNVCMNTFAAGGRIIFHPRVDLAALGEMRLREQPTYMVQSPTGFMMAMNTPGFDPQQLSHTELIVCGGAATPLNILKAWQPIGCPIVSVYGQTETCGIITHTDIAAPLPDVAETIGRPLAESDARIARPDNTECNDGETGELQFRGPYVMSGYYNRPQATADAFTSDGYLRTGDIGFRRADGNLVFVGRIKEMFKSGGYNVYPLEVEQAITEHDDVLLAAVLPVVHDLYQEVGHAFVMPQPGQTVTEEALRASLKTRIANYKVPKHFTIAPELPLLPNGKVDKRALAKRLEQEQGHES